MPTPTQAWLRFERGALGLGLRQAATTFGTSLSVIQRAERGGPNGARDPGEVNQVLWWWRQHPLDRLALCLKSRAADRSADWQTPMRHVTRQLSPLPAVLGGASALDLLLPPAGRAPAPWTLDCPWITENAVVLHRYLGVIELRSAAFPDRSVGIPNFYGQLPGSGLRLAYPRDLMQSLGWSPQLAAAVHAADLAGPVAMAGVGYPRRLVRRHRSLEIVEEFDDDEWEQDEWAQDEWAQDESEEAASGHLVEAGDDPGQNIRVGFWEHAMAEVEDVARR